MIRSMTGFGEASATARGAHYFVEIRSLNNKYFKASIRLSEEFQGLEAEMESRLRERLSRGTITVTARCADTSEAAAYEINERALSRYLEKLRAIPGVGDRVDPAALLHLPGVLLPPGNEEERFEEARGVFLPLLDKACDALIAMREREGRNLVADLRAQHDLIADRLSGIVKMAPRVIADYEERLKGRIELLIKSTDARVEPGDLVREIAVYAEKTDIAEETKRLATHLEQFRELIAGKDGRPVGRTLDFLAQEMLREANTIASKSPDASISRASVEIKGAIDRIKEQAANVE